MQGNIYKVAENITKEEILQVCEYREHVSEYGDVMQFEEFMKYVKCGALIDYDGYGRIILFGKEVANSSLWIDNETVYITDKLFIPFNVIHELFGNDVKVNWFNR